MKDFFSKRHRIELSTLDLLQFRVFQVIWTLGALGLLAFVAVLTWIGTMAQLATLWK